MNILVYWCCRQNGKFYSIFHDFWTYWHSPMWHCLVCVAIYEFYNEICDGHLDLEWDNPQKDWLGFWDFRIKLSEQMLQYCPKNQKYKGDASMRQCSKVRCIKQKNLESLEEAEAELISLKTNLGHSPMWHCLAIVCVAIYEIYNEICDGHLDPEWDVPQKDWLSSWDFRIKLSEQMLQYCPKNQKYKGDASMRQCTKVRCIKQKNLESLEWAEAELITLKPNLGQGLTTKLLQKAKMMGCRKLPCLCNQKDGWFALLWKHFVKMEMQMNAAQCNMCKKKTKLKCLICVFK